MVERKKLGEVYGETEKTWGGGIAQTKVIFKNQSKKILKNYPP